VSLIGTLEKIELSRVLERIESHNKTGLLVIKPGGHWVELYFRAGRLMCIGPVRTQASLGERLFQEGLITAQALQEVAQVLGGEQFRETRMALTLMDMGYVSHEKLRSWASRKAIEVLQVLFSWSSGEIYFDDDVQPPPDRLLVALAISSLLSAMPPKPVSAAPSQPVVPASPVTRNLREQPGATSTPDIAKYPTLMSATQFFEGAQASAQPVAPPSPIPASPAPSQMSATEALSPLFEAAFDSVFSTEENQQSSEPPMSEVIPPQHVDTTFMRPEMVMMPADLSSVRDQYVQFLLTPEHWGLLTRIDGRTSLGTASYELQMSPDVICRLAGQLQALGLIQLSLPGQWSYNGELSPVSQGPASPELKGSYLLPGYAAASPSPWSASLLASDNMAQIPSSSPSFDVQPPWGNVPNGVTNMQSQSWNAAPYASQPMSTNGPFLNSDVYVHTK
jgi:Domain of unknown function (DUF4388)